MAAHEIVSNRTLGGSTVGGCMSLITTKETLPLRAIECNVMGSQGGRSPKYTIITTRGRIPTRYLHARRWLPTDTTACTTPHW